MIKYAIPVTLGMIGWTVMFGINTIFIERFYGSEAVAYYSVGLTIVQVFAFFPEAIVTIMMPRVASIKDVSRIRQRLNQAVLATLVVSVVILAPLMIFKGRIVTIMFTEKYLAGVATILPLALGQIAISVYQIYGAVWQGLGKPGIPSLTISIAATLNVGGSYFLTKLSGINGAALSLAVTSVLALIIMYGFWTRWKRNLASSLKPSPGMVDASK
jgi:stage V sporulation protein B